MARTPFRSARTKAEWARLRIQELKNALEWLRGQKGTCSYYYDAQSTAPSLDISVTVRKAPADLSLLVGDVARSLRSALDCVATQIVTENSSGKKNVAFPFSSTLDELEELLKKSPLGEILPEALDLILNTIKPSKAENPLLWSVSCLERMDRYTGVALKLEAKSVQLTEVSYRDGTSSTGVVIKVTEGHALMPFALSDVVEVRFHDYAVLGIVFTPPSPLRKKDAVSSLTSMHRLVVEAIDALETVYLRSQNREDEQ